LTPRLGPSAPDASPMQRVRVGTWRLGGPPRRGLYMSPPLCLTPSRGQVVGEAAASQQPPLHLLELLSSRPGEGQRPSRLRWCSVCCPPLAESDGNWEQFPSVYQSCWLAGCWLAGWLSGWLVVAAAGWTAGRLAGVEVGRPAVEPISPPAGRQLAGWLALWPTCRLAHRLPCPPVHWLARWLARWPVFWLAG